MGRDWVQPPWKWYSHTSASQHQVTCHFMLNSCGVWQLWIGFHEFMIHRVNSETFDIKKKLTRNWIAVLIRQARRFRQKITKSNWILCWHRSADIQNIKRCIIYIYRALLWQALGFNFLSDMRSGRKRAGSGKTNNPREIKWHLKGRKGNKKREREIRRLIRRVYITLQEEKSHYPLKMSHSWTKCPFESNLSNKWLKISKN